MIFFKFNHKSVGDSIRPKIELDWLIYSNRHEISHGVPEEDKFGGGLIWMETFKNLILNLKN